MLLLQLIECKRCWIACTTKDLNQQYKKYKHIKWLFPNPHISTLNCGDVEFCQSDKARCKYLETAWKKLTELTGIDGQKKLFRKVGCNY